MSDIGNIKNVKGIVEEAVGKSRLLKEGIIRGNWKNIVGEDFSKYCFVIALKERVLYIGVENSVWIHHLNLKKNMIIKSVNENLGTDYVKDIIIRTAVRKKESEYTEETEDNINLDELILKEEDYEKADSVSNSIDDLAIKDHIKKLIIYSKQKEKYLTLKGYKKCSNCGILYDGIDRVCITCKNNLKLELKKEVYKILRKYPSIEYEEINKIRKYKNIRKEEFLDVKSKLKDEYSKKMMRAINKDDVEEYKRNARIFFILETGEKSPKEIEKRVLNYLKWL